MALQRLLDLEHELWVGAFSHLVLAERGRSLRGIAQVREIT